MDRLAGLSNVIEEVILRFVLGLLNSWVLWARRFGIPAFMFYFTSSSSPFSGFLSLILFYFLFFIFHFFFFTGASGDSLPVAPVWSKDTLFFSFGVEISGLAAHVTVVALFLFFFHLFFRLFSFILICLRKIYPYNFLAAPHSLPAFAFSRIRQFI
jgi:hypothetical protein